MIDASAYRNSWPKPSSTSKRCRHRAFRWARRFTMNPHNNHDLVERFSMGRLQGAELTDFEAHLPQCDEWYQRRECLEAVVPLKKETSNRSREPPPQLSFVRPPYRRR